MFGDSKIEKHEFYRYKSPIFQKMQTLIINILASNKISSDEKNYKYFIDYLYDDYKVKLLYLMLPRTSSFVKSYHGYKWM